jgi:hypothetical protein
MGSLGGLGKIDDIRKRTGSQDDSEQGFDEEAIV